MSIKIRDGRFVILIYIVIYLCGMFIATNTLGYDKGMRFFDIPPMLPAFADLHVIVGAFETESTGVNPYIYNPYDPWNRPVNYPRVWMLLGDLGLTHQNIFFAGIIMAAAFLFTVFKILGKITPLQGVYCALVVCSSSTVLAIERGNNDLIIFMLVTYAAYLLSTPGTSKISLSGGIILLASILKLYPVFSLAMMLKLEKKLLLQIIGAFTLLFSVYIIITFSDLLHIFSNTPKAANRSFGTVILPALLVGPPEASTPTEEKKAFINTMLITGNILLIILLLGIFYQFKKVSRIYASVTKSDSFKLNLFRAGVGIFIGTFALGNNFDYRLIFLLLTLPQLLYWYSHSAEIRKHCFITLGLILAMVQWNFFSFEWNLRITFLNEISCWVLVGYLWYLFLLSLPRDVIRDFLKIRNKDTA